ncbi:hypothetical protein K435DRAFT_310543 [Dendrothele bispora CBS 962.96]|uniref:Amino acid transporter transmembrane domain-containing protein n=1 Tax=Dendrothele bispora (strain CBS 962.96) TaxID=1314807 RepID=A0A4S8MJW4_DENBC|nr:hypothetical protein K435DRAFT_310543 [Dendrothele bispora CBS 962.96]
MNHARHSSEDFDSESGRSSPNLAGLDSTSALILVNESDEEAPLNFTSREQDDLDYSPDIDDFDSIPVLTSPNLQPLSSTSVFLYLLSPYLKLGATLLPNVDLPLKFGLPALFLFAVLSAFARQIWYMLSRYMRKPELEDIVADAFGRGRGKERRRRILRSLVRAGTGVLRMSLATIYLREAAHLLPSLLPDDLTPVPVFIMTLILGVFLFPLVLAKSLASKRVVYATWASIATFVLWLACVIFAYSKGTLGVSPTYLRMGTLWQSITTIAFTFTSSTTLSLYASLKANKLHHYHPHSSANFNKTPISRSFKTISLVSVAVAVCLTLPLVFFAAAPNHPTVQEDSPGARVAPFIVFLKSATLFFGIPSILVTTPSLPIPERIRRSVTIQLSKIIIFLLIVVLAMVPAKITGVLSDILIVCALSATYFLPALIHITTHFFKRPLSIIMPSLSSPNTPNPATASTVQGSASLSSTATGGFPPDPPDSANDPLLQRKEAALQKKQFRKRLVWDFGVWVLLLPVGGGGFVWAVGTLAGKW